jgi:hypothetical protein
MSSLVNNTLHLYKHTEGTENVNTKRIDFKICHRVKYIKLLNEPDDDSKEHYCLLDDHCLNVLRCERCRCCRPFHRRVRLAPHR